MGPRPGRWCDLLETEELLYEELAILNEAYERLTGSIGDLNRWFSRQVLYIVERRDLSPHAVEMHLLFLYHEWRRRRCSMQGWVDRIILRICECHRLLVFHLEDL